VLISSAGGGRSNSNLTSPNGELAAAASSDEVAGATTDALEQTVDGGGGNSTETIKHSSSSIIGLRAAAFDPLPIKAAGGPADLSAPSDDIAGPKPRPPPKPRPWSLVGVDRKSGEFTQVESSSSAVGSGENSAAADPLNDESEHRTTGRGGFLVPQRVGVGIGGSVRDRIASLNKPETAANAAGGILGGGGSVRDRIANMNKSAVAGGGAASDAVTDKQRKGNSLPRTVAEASSSASAGSSPSCRPKNSPKNLRKESDTTDDPRILKLDDDFMYEDTVNV
jgi:hypothetical protein